VTVPAPARATHLAALVTGLAMVAFSVCQAWGVW
jgi:hypothetical protein